RLASWGGDGPSGGFGGAGGRGRARRPSLRHLRRLPHAEPVRRNRNRSDAGGDRGAAHWSGGGIRLLRGPAFPRRTLDRGESGPLPGRPPGFRAGESDGLRGAPRSGGTGRPRPAPSYPRGGARAAGGHRVSLTERWEARGGSPSGQKDVDHHESSADEGPQEVSQADDEAEFAVRDAPNQLL